MLSFSSPSRAHSSPRRPSWLLLVGAPTARPGYGRPVSDAEENQVGIRQRPGRMGNRAPVSQVLSFQEGLAAVRTAGQNKWGFLNRDGNWEIPPNYGKKRSAYQRYGGEKFYDPPFGPFHGEYAPALVDSAPAFINKAGEVVKRSPEYSVLRPFYDERAVFARDGEKGYINKNWEVVIEPEVVDQSDARSGDWVAGWNPPSVWHLCSAMPWARRQSPCLDILSGCCPRPLPPRGAPQ